MKRACPWTLEPYGQTLQNSIMKANEEDQTMSCYDFRILQSDTSTRVRVEVNIEKFDTRHVPDSSKKLK